MMKTTVSASPSTSMNRCSPMLCRRCEITGMRSRSGFLRDEMRVGEGGGASTSTVGAAGSVDISVPHPRVDERGDDVDDEVRQSDDDRDHDDDALHGDEVAGFDVLRQHEADP